MSTTNYIATLQATINQWYSELSPVEYQTLLFIIERTLRFNKEWESIPIRHFDEGVYSFSDVRIIAGVKARRTSIVDAYRALAEKGLIMVKRTRNGTGKNVFKVVVKAIVEGAKELSKLKISKKRTQKAMHAGAQEVCTQVHSTNAPGCTPILSTHLEEHISNTTSTPDEDQESLSDIISRARKLNLQKREAKAKKADSKLTITTLKATWSESVSTHFGKTATPSVTSKDIAILKSVVTANTLPLPFTQFTDWVVENWEELSKNEFSWMTKNPMPAIPDLMFYCRFSKEFVKAYAEYQRRTTLEVKRKDRSDKDAHEARTALSQAEEALRQAEVQRKRAEAERDRFRKQAATAQRRVVQRTGDMVEIGEGDLSSLDEDLPSWD